MVSECVNLEILRYAVDPAAAAAASNAACLNQESWDGKKPLLSSHSSTIIIVQSHGIQVLTNSGGVRGCPFPKGQMHNGEKRGKVLILGSVFYDGPYSEYVPSYTP